MTVQEYLVSLGVQTDQKSISKVNSFFQSTNRSVMALAGLLVAGTTALTKFTISMSKQLVEMEKEAKRRRVGLETIRAEENALKALGTTREKLAKDKSLKAQYDELVKMNELMALPNSEKALKTIESVSMSWYKLKSTVQYCLQWLNHHILTKLQAPLERMAKRIDKFRETLATNMPNWTAKVADGIQKVVKILAMWVNYGVKIIEFVRNLPAEVKNLAGAFAIVWAVLRGNPIMTLLWGLTQLMLLIDDYMAWKYKNENADMLMEQGIEIQTVHDDWWEAMDAGTIGEKIQKKVGEIALDLSTFFENIKKWIDENPDALTKIAESIGSAISAALNIAVTVGQHLIDVFNDPAVQLAAEAFWGTVMDGFMSLMPKSMQELFGWEAGAWKEGVDKKREQLEYQKKVDAAAKENQENGIYGYDPKTARLYSSREMAALSLGDLPTLRGESVTQYVGGNPEDIYQRALAGAKKSGTGDRVFELSQQNPERFKELQPQMPVLMTDEETTTWSKLTGAFNRAVVYDKVDSLNDIIDALFTFQDAINGSNRTFHDIDSLSEIPTDHAAVQTAEDAHSKHIEKYGYGAGLSYAPLAIEELQRQLATAGHTVPAEHSFQPFGGGYYGKHTSIMPKIDEDAASQAGKEATNLVQDSVGTVSVPIDINLLHGGGGRKFGLPDGGLNAVGGKYDSPTNVTVAEDGDGEYIIPYKKPHLAVPLINRMLGEMGMGSLDNLLSRAGNAINTMVSGAQTQAPLLASAGQSAVIYNTYNTITATANISVTGTGDPVATANAANNSFAGFLVRQLKGMKV